MAMNPALLATGERRTFLNTAYIALKKETLQLPSIPGSSGSQLAFVSWLLNYIFFLSPGLFCKKGELFELRNCVLSPLVPVVHSLVSGMGPK